MILLLTQKKKPINFTYFNLLSIFQAITDVNILAWYMELENLLSNPKAEKTNDKLIDWLQFEVCFFSQLFQV